MKLVQGFTPAWLETICAGIHMPPEAADMAEAYSGTSSRIAFVLKNSPYPRAKFKKYPDTNINSAI